MNRSCFTLAIVFALLYPANLIAQSCQLNPPTGLFITELTSCSATLHWKSNAVVAQYKVSYKLSTQTNWSGQINVGLDTFYHFTGLLPGLKYYFSVKEKCPDGSGSEKKKKSATTLPCSIPDLVTIEGLNAHTAKITVNTSCSYDSLFVNYRTQHGLSQIISFPFADSYELPGLNFDSTYLVRVSVCPLAAHQWSVPDTLHLSPPPNIIFLLVDDSRYDYFSCNGAPSFYHTPNIDRIANEGVNFKKSFCVTSLCQPSRASIATGLFTLKTGVTENGIPLDTSFVTIPEVLNNSGYYTALIGKNDNAFLNGSIPEYAYYMVFKNYDANDGKKYDYNGIDKYIDKDYILTLTDSTIGLINRIKDPMFIWLAYVVPHYPQKPLPSFQGKYDSYAIPWQADTAEYTINYPSFIYTGAAQTMHGEQLDTTYRNVLEEIAGLDSCVGEIFKALENSGKLNNTLLIFMSDNGFMEGAHWLDGKTHAYEPSMRIPLFMRYPQWFAPSSLVTDQFALNLDITPTVYEAAQVTYNEPLDGLSLKDLYDGTASRKEFYYLMLHNPTSLSPSKRAIRDQHYKYIHYNCICDTVDELFDELNDSLELTNLIHNSDYAAVAQQYRLKFDSIRIALNDTAEGSLKNCYISNPTVLKQLFENEEIIPEQPVIYPTVTNGYIEIYIPWESAHIILYDDFGKWAGDWQLTENFTQLALPDVPDGMYLLKFLHKGGTATQKLIVAR